MNTYINTFPGYTFVYFDSDKKMHNVYRGVDVGKGGYVYSEPGMYGNVAVLDVQSQHPNSIIAMNCFGDYTAKFEELLDTRIALKHKDIETARKMFNGRLEPYLQNEESAAALSQALKIAINSVYGITAANFDNPFRDPRNLNNIVALRGALFMKTLQDEVQARGFVVAHIKTDSIKLPDATPEIIQFCMDFGKQYGYIFELESTYDRICLVNKSTYIARYKDGKKAGQWEATGLEFQVSYVYKTLFTKEDITFDDLCETKEVKTAMHLDMNEGLPEEEHARHFIGKVGRMCPIKSGCGGGELVRESKDKDGNIKYNSVTGAKGYRWLEAETVQTLGKEGDIDLSYYEKQVEEAKASIRNYGQVEWFCSDKSYDKYDNEILPF